MRIALISDVHDCITNLLLALQQAEEMGCERLFFMGDIADTGTLRILLEEWQHPVDIVFGNNEYDLEAHLSITAQHTQARHHEFEADIEVEQRRIFFTHIPRRAKAIAQAGRHHAVFYGHTHVADLYKHGTTLVVNPGEVAGVRRPPCFAVYDTATNDAIFYRL